MVDQLADHYRTLREERGLEEMDDSLGALSASYVRRAFVCAFARGGIAAGERSLVTVGMRALSPARRF